MVEDTHRFHSIVESSSQVLTVSISSRNRDQHQLTHKNDWTGKGGTVLDWSETGTLYAIPEVGNKSDGWEVTATKSAEGAYQHNNSSPLVSGLTTNVELALYVSAS